jgi:hypothetical protein
MFVSALSRDPRRAEHVRYEQAGRTGGAPNYNHTRKSQKSQEEYWISIGRRSGVPANSISLLKSSMIVASQGGPLCGSHYTSKLIREVKQPD